MRHPRNYLRRKFAETKIAGHMRRSIYKVARNHLLKSKVALSLLAFSEGIDFSSARRLADAIFFGW